MGVGEMENGWIFSVKKKERERKEKRNIKRKKHLTKQKWKLFF